MTVGQAPEKREVVPKQPGVVSSSAARPAPVDNQSSFWFRFEEVCCGATDIFRNWDFQRALFHFGRAFSGGGRVAGNIKTPMLALAGLIVFGLYFSQRSDSSETAQINVIINSR